MDSVRVSNELGAGDFKAAKFSVWVVSITSVFIGVVAMIGVLSTKDYFPYLFTTSVPVANETTRLASCHSASKQPSTSPIRLVPQTMNTSKVHYPIEDCIVFYKLNAIF